MFSCQDHKCYAAFSRSERHYSGGSIGLLRLKCSYSDYQDNQDGWHVGLVPSFTHRGRHPPGKIIDLHLTLCSGISSDRQSLKSAHRDQATSIDSPFLNIPFLQKRITRRSVHTAPSSPHAYSGVGTLSCLRFLNCSQRVIFLQ